MKQKGKVLLACILCLSLLLSAAILPASAAESRDADTVIEALTVNFATDPVGIEADNIRFGWKMSSSLIGQAQAAYQIIVTDPAGETVWDSETVEDDRSVAIPYAGPALAAETAYTWQVTVTDVSGQTFTSAPATFETGCDWGDTQWISVEDYSNEMNSLLFRTE